MRIRRIIIVAVGFTAALLLSAGRADWLEAWAFLIVFFYGCCLHAGVGCTTQSPARQGAVPPCAKRGEMGHSLDEVLSRSSTGHARGFGLGLRSIRMVVRADGRADLRLDWTWGRAGHSLVGTVGEPVCVALGAHSGESGA